MDSNPHLLPVRRLPGPVPARGAAEAGTTGAGRRPYAPHSPQPNKVMNNCLSGPALPLVAMPLAILGTLLGRSIALAAVLRPALLPARCPASGLPWRLRGSNLKSARS